MKTTRILILAVFLSLPSPNEAAASLTSHLAAFPTALPSLNVPVAIDRDDGESLCDPSDAAVASQAKTFFQNVIAAVNDQRRRLGTFPKTLSSQRKDDLGWTVVYHPLEVAFALELRPTIRGTALQERGFPTLVSCSHFAYGTRKEAAKIGLFAPQQGSGLYYDPRLGLYTLAP